MISTNIVNSRAKPLSLYINDIICTDIKGKTVEHFMYCIYSIYRHLFAGTKGN